MHIGKSHCLHLEGGGLAAVSSLPTANNTFQLLSFPRGSGGSFSMKVPPCETVGRRIRDGATSMVIHKLSCLHLLPAGL